MGRSRTVPGPVFAVPQARSRFEPHWHNHRRKSNHSEIDTVMDDNTASFQARFDSQALSKITYEPEHGPPPHVAHQNFFHCFTTGPNSWTPTTLTQDFQAFFRVACLLCADPSSCSHFFGLLRAGTSQPLLMAGGGIASRSMRSRIASNNFLGIATSASWNVTYFACRVTFAPIFTSFSRRVVSDQCFTSRGKASRRRKLARL